MIFQTTGYDSKTILANAARGVFDGIDSVLCCYAFAAIVLNGVMTFFYRWISSSCWATGSC